MGGMGAAVEGGGGVVNTYINSTANNRNIHAVAVHVTKKNKMR